MHAVIVTRTARQQIIKTLLYTHKQFGESKQLVYNKLIADALAAIAQNPKAGKARPDIAPDIWSYHIARSGLKARHLLIYRLRENRVEILRFLYDGMDLLFHMKD